MILRQHQPFNARQTTRQVVLIVVTIMTVACSAVPAWFSTPSTQSVSELSRCGANPTSLCLVSFGLDENHRMLLSFFIPAASFTGYSLKVQYNETTTLYPCQVLKDFRTTIYCTGDTLPLGASITVEIYSTAGNVLLARGPFVIDAMAIPTPPIAAGTPASQSDFHATPESFFGSAASTGTPSRTPTPSGSYPNP